MQTRILIVLCLAVCYNQKVYAEGENAVKRGSFPYIAFVYYSDPAITDETGARFLRSAVLIQSNWLITSALGSSTTNDVSPGFPRKTLLARLGAVTIDANFTFNEDEDEQEREVIKIVRPYNYSATQWWRNDLTLMNTLLPFNMTAAVGVTTLKLEHDYAEKTCIILVYAQKYGNWSGEKILIQHSVGLLSPSIKHCGNNFINQTMACGTDIDENAISDRNFCYGNSGGPLVCEGEVLGLQTYIENNCSQPYLYQILSVWGNLINCSINDKCQEEQCEKVCDVINKDTPVPEVVNSMSNEDFITFTSIKIIENMTMSPTVSPNTEIDFPTMSKVSKITKELKTLIPEFVNTTVGNSFRVNTADGDVSELSARPYQKIKKQLEKLDQEDLENGHKPAVKAQHHKVNKEIVLYSATPRIMCTFQTIFFGISLLAYFV